MSYTLVDIDSIKPDPNQPRRKFDEEKMQSLIASIRSDGFRPEYPIVIDENRVIIDGERRWRAAQEVPVDVVPVEIRKNVSDYERLMFQLQSEGAELEDKDKFEAWVRAFDMGSKYGNNYRDIAQALGIHENTFRSTVQEYKGFLKLTQDLKKRGVKTNFEDNYGSLSDVTREKDSRLQTELAEKAVKEKWTRDKTREIRRAIHDNPKKADQILSVSYADTTTPDGKTIEGDSWRSKLKVAASDLDLEQVRDINETREKLEGQIDAFDTIITCGIQLSKAMNELDYTLLKPEMRAKLHSYMVDILPAATEYITELEQYMISKGELTESKARLMA